MSDDASPRLGLPYLAAAQAQKHVILNEALMRLDGLVQTAVESRSTAAQPASPADGALYLLPEDAAGAAWAGRPAGTVMRFEAGGWATLAVGAGHLAWVKDEAGAVVWDGAAWAAFPPAEATPAARVLVASPGGANLGVEVREEEVTLAGATTSTSMVIPSRGIVLAVSTRTTQTVTGASSYSCGIGGEAGKFGSSLGVALNASNIGVIGPTAFYSDTPVVLTAAGSAFTGGKVTVAIQVLTFAAPGAV
ncbi:MAG: DUF2793 domain-containing protein [Caulobacteraceae bacterium]|nr:DUF2793 domain-containing protein [Caulobacteraceae bacterium]